MTETILQMATALHTVGTTEVAGSIGVAYRVAAVSVVSVVARQVALVALVAAVSVVAVHMGDSEYGTAGV